MHQPNYAALSEGLKLYTDALRALIKERLSAAYGEARWWQAGVLDVLAPKQRAELTDQVQEHPDRDAIDYVDPSHFVWLIGGRNAESGQSNVGLFREVFGDMRRIRSLLTQVSVTRNNDWAHPRSGDLEADSVAHALYEIEQVLLAAKRPEAATVEAIRKELGGQVEARPPAEPTEAAILPAARWEYRDLGIPIDLKVDTEEAERRECERIVLEHLQQEGRQGWQAEGPTDFRSLQAAGRVQRGGFDLAFVYDNWRTRVKLITVRLRRQIR